MIVDFTASRSHSVLAFSCPSVITTTITVPGRSCSGAAASSSPISVVKRPIPSSSAVLPRGRNSRAGTSPIGIDR
ncbi:hypothetical protein G419_15943 [Rhodococcus triatomae BKS 15-14]|nr:hypothetical protein G419_15943 [Rhodococcus triatomae BKS 15-14]